VNVLKLSLNLNYALAVEFVAASSASSNRAAFVFLRFSDGAASIVILRPLYQIFRASLCVSVPILPLPFSAPLR